jgi:TatD DNase family protein
VHPHHASELDESGIGELARLLELPGVVAVGECGLDFFRDFSPRPVQEQAFRVQLELAARTGYPLFLHQREAHQRFLALLDGVFPAGAAGVAHCFTYGRREMEAYLERGLHIGITGWICDERRGSALREAVRHLPVERLLVETDAPYLLPRDLQPKPSSRRNEPCHLPHVLAVLGRWMDADSRRLAEAATENAIRLFRLDGIAKK